jgi:competence protein ComEC
VEPTPLLITTKTRASNCRNSCGLDISALRGARLLGKIGEVDIYKVSHHGSRYQDFQLMTELSPQLAIISVGVENTFGHPAPEVLSALERTGTRVLRTDRDGAVAVHATDHRLTVQRAKRWTRLFSWY